MRVILIQTTTQHQKLMPVPVTTYLYNLFWQSTGSRSESKRASKSRWLINKIPGWTKLTARSLKHGNSTCSWLTIAATGNKQKLPYQFPCLCTKTCRSDCDLLATYLAGSQFFLSPTRFDSFFGPIFHALFTAFNWLEPNWLTPYTFGHFVVLETEAPRTWRKKSKEAFRVQLLGRWSFSF